MKLAVNFSPQASDLLKSGQIQFDLFKTPDWQDMVEVAIEFLPVYVHFDLSVGDGRLAHADWSKVDDFLEKTGTKIVNLHVVSPTDLDPCNHGQVEALQDQIIHEVQTVCKRYNPERVITENIPLPRCGKEYLRPGALPPFSNALSLKPGRNDWIWHMRPSRQNSATRSIYFSAFPVRDARNPYNRTWIPRRESTPIWR